MNYMNKPPGRMRANIAGIAAIVIGLVIGILIKRVHVGLMIGLGLGALASVLLRRR